VFQLWIDSSLMVEYPYISGVWISYNIDGFDLGIHDIEIKAWDDMEQLSTYTNQFTVFDSVVITIEQLDDYQEGDTGNLLIFNIQNMYPNWFNVTVDDVLMAEGYYISGESITIGIDGYTEGVHTVSIYADNTFGSEATQMAQFYVTTAGEIINVTIKLKVFVKVDGFRTIECGNGRVKQIRHSCFMMMVGRVEVQYNNATQEIVDFENVLHEFVHDWVDSHIQNNWLHDLILANYEIIWYDWRFV